MSDLQGKFLGQYEILEVLGHGGMAVVYRAHQASMDRDVAIKVIAAQMANNPDFIVRFEHEARNIAHLQHPHILPVYDFGHEEDRLYLVMRLVDGGSLDDRIRRGPLPAKLAAQMLTQIASALSYVHEHGIIHRDLKPNNILLDKKENVYLTDFGISKMLQGHTQLTSTGQIVGTPAYMAPEQWRSEELDLRTDIYALGVMFYEMLTGVQPFQGDTPFQVMYKHFDTEPPSVRIVRPDLPEPIMAVLRRAMAKRKEDRYPSADKFAEEASAVLNDPTRAAFNMPKVGEMDQTFVPDTKAGQSTPAMNPVDADGTFIGEPTPTPGKAPAALQTAAGTPFAPTPSRALPTGLIAVIAVVVIVVLLGAGALMFSKSSPTPTLVPTSIVVQPTYTIVSALLSGGGTIDATATIAASPTTVPTTNTVAPSNTFQPPTNTLVPPTVAPSPIPPTATTAPTPFHLTIFHAGDTLTLYISDTGTVNLTGLTVQGNGLNKSLKDFPAFNVLPFDSLKGPLCFRFEGSQQTAPIPAECQQVPPTQLYIQQLTPSDMFYEANSQPQAVSIMRDGSTLAQCNATSPQCQMAQPVNLTVIRSVDALTIYVSSTGYISLEGLTIETATATGQKLSKRLDSFPSFGGLPFDRIVAPACFQLENSQSVAPLPLACQQLPANQLFTERLVPADMIWYDSVARQPRLVLISRDGEDPVSCPGTEPSCDIAYIPSAPAIALATSPTRAPVVTVIPLTGALTVRQSTPFRSGPGPNYTILANVDGGDYDITGQNEDGTYYQVNYNGTVAWISAFASTVTIKIAAAASPTPTALPLDSTLTYGQTVTGALDRNGKTDYKFIGKANEIISITVDGKFDSYLELHSSDGFTLKEDDNSGGNNNPQINGFTLPNDGEYHIVLRGYSARDMGAFRLTLLSGAIPVFTDDNGFQYGQKLIDHIGPNGQVDRTFNGTQGDVVSVVVDADFDTYLQLTDDKSNVLDTEDDSADSWNPLLEYFELPATGQYHLILRGRTTNSQGTYTMTLLRTAPGDATSIAYNQTLTDRLDPKGQHLYVFEASGKQRVTITVSVTVDPSSSFDTSLDLRDEHGALIASDDDSGGDLQPAIFNQPLAQNGKYYFIIIKNKSDSDGGQYTIKLEGR